MNHLELNKSFFNSQTMIHEAVVLFKKWTWNAFPIDIAGDRQLDAHHDLPSFSFISHILTTFGCERVIMVVTCLSDTSKWQLVLAYKGG